MKQLFGNWGGEGKELTRNQNILLQAKYVDFQAENVKFQNVVVRI